MTAFPKSLRYKKTKVLPGYFKIDGRRHNQPVTGLFLFRAL